MERKRGFMAQLILAVTFLMYFIGAASAGCIGNVTGIDYGCGDTVIDNCTFTKNLNCTTRYGLIIGADGITIDGNGYTLDGVSSGACDDPGIYHSGIYNKRRGNGQGGVILRCLKTKTHNIEYNHISQIGSITASEC